MHGYIDPFYEAASKALEPGHVWCDQPLYLPPRHGLKLTRVNPQDDRDLDMEIVGRTADTFQHNPVKSLGLASTEAMVVAKTKRDRPVILLGGLSASEILPGQRPRHTEIAWAVPVYGGDQYDEETRLRMRRYDFNNLFYLPEDRGLGFDEGFAQLDHAQPVWQHHLSRHRGMKLSGDALDALQEWFIYFSTGILDQESLILEYRRDQADGRDA